MPRPRPGFAGGAAEMRADDPEELLVRERLERGPPAQVPEPLLLRARPLRVLDDVDAADAAGRARASRFVHSESLPVTPRKRPSISISRLSGE